MRRFLRAMIALSAGVCVGCAAPAPPSQTAALPQTLPASSTLLPTPIVVQNLHPSPDRPGTIVGEWSADVKDRGPRAPVQLTINRQDDKAAATTNTYWRSDTPIEGLSGAGVVGAVHFGLSRSAGAMTFDGSSDGKTGQGIVRFEPDSTYSADIQRMYGAVSAERFFELAACGYELNYAQSLYDAGYRFALPDALAMYLGSVPADYAIDLHRAGYEFAFADIMHLHHAGILAGYAAEVRAGGYQLSAEELILLNHSGISADFAVAMRQAGAAATVSDLVYLQHSEVSADYARQFASAGYRFSAADLVKLRQAAIGAEYAIAMRKAGYALNADDLVRLNKASVDADYASALIVAGHDNLSPDDLIQLRQKGVDADMIRRLRK